MKERRLDASTQVIKSVVPFAFLFVFLPLVFHCFEFNIISVVWESDRRDAILLSAVFNTVLLLVLTSFARAWYLSPGKVTEEINVRMVTSLSHKRSRAMYDQPLLRTRTRKDTAERATR